MKNLYLLLLLILLTSFSNLNAQTTSITYYDLKEMTDGTFNQAVALFKAKGFKFENADESGVSYSDNDKYYFLAKLKNNSVLLSLYSDPLEKISTNIKNTVIKLGYKESESYTFKNNFCVKYLSTNYIIDFCDSKIKYRSGKEDSKFTIRMKKR